MFAIKNAVKNIYRYKSKYILFGILYLILILTASVCVSIFVRMGQVTDNIIREYAGVVKLYERGIDSEGKMIPTRFGKDEYLQYMAGIEHIDDIKFFRYNFATNYLKENIPELELELTVGGNIKPLDLSSINPVLVSGYNMSLLHLVPDEFNLESGRMFENDGEAVIMKSPEPVNNAWQDLDLGDKIVIKNNAGIYKEFTVVGIQQSAENAVSNLIYTTLESAEYFDSFASDEKLSYMVLRRNDGIISTADFHKTFIDMGYEAALYLDSYENFEVLQNKMLEKKLYIVPFFQNFNALVLLTKVMQSNSAGFMIITGFIIIFMTIISTVISLSSRKYEIAVLRSAGMKKINLIRNYLIENLAFIWGISIVSLIAAQFIAKPFTGRVFESMREFVSAETFENLVKGINFELLMQNAGLVFGGTTAIVMLSLVLACINIVRFEPLKIFNKQY